MKLKKLLKNPIFLGGIIGFLFGLILILSSIIFGLLDELNFLEKILFSPFIFVEWLTRFKLSLCTGLGCLIYFVFGGILIYLLIGILIAFILNLKRYFIKK